MSVTGNKSINYSCPIIEGISDEKEKGECVILLSEISILKLRYCSIFRTKRFPMETPANPCISSGENFLIYHQICLLRSAVLKTVSHKGNFLFTGGV
jgi:hypothetical protein